MAGQDGTAEPITLRNAVRDRVLLSAVVLGTILRILPLILWRPGCMRDECSYARLAQHIVAGDGLVTQENWLWAPGYPYLLAGHVQLFGTPQTIQVLQITLAAATGVLLYALTRRLYGRRAGRIAAWVFALHPTLAFFAGRMWSESLYTFVLIAAVYTVFWVREGPWFRALLTGFLIGICVLFRGIATYMAPFFALAVTWPDGSWRQITRRWRHAVAVLVAVFVTVAPYSYQASTTHGGFILSDATLGRMAWLGNNDFPPITFDYGNGALRTRSYRGWTRTGRGECDSELSAAEWNACEVSNAVTWIRENPTTFLERIPQRVAQLVNPHSFVTRHIRLGHWKHMPFVIKEGLVLLVAGTTFLVLVGGGLGGWLRGRGPFALLAVGITGYHVVAISALAGLTRYRVPLEPLWIVFLSVLLAHPLAVRHARPWRFAGALVTLPLLVWLMLWYLPTGFPGFW